MEMAGQAWGVFFVLCGVVLGSLTLLLVVTNRALRRLIIGLAKLGPSTGRQLADAGYAKRGSVYTYLRHMEEQGLVRSRKVPLSIDVIYARGSVPEYEFRLTTKGWSQATLLSAKEKT